MRTLFVYLLICVLSDVIVVQSYRMARQCEHKRASSLHSMSAEKDPGVIVVLSKFADRRINLIKSISNCRNFRIMKQAREVDSDFDRSAVMSCAEFHNMEWTV